MALVTKTAVMVRLSESEVRALDALARKNGIPRATCATSILRQRLRSAEPERPAKSITALIKDGMK